MHIELDLVTSIKYVNEKYIKLGNISETISYFHNNKKILSKYSDINSIKKLNLLW